jgi:hypothetical protein
MSTTYHIRVKEHLADHWTHWFDGLEITAANGESLLSGPLADQAALFGVLARIRDLGLTLLAVESTTTDTERIHPAPLHAVPVSVVTPIDIVQSQPEHNDGKKTKTD